MTQDLMPIYADDYEFRRVAEGDIVRIGVNQLSTPVLVALGFFALAAFWMAAARWLAGSLAGRLAEPGRVGRRRCSRGPDLRASRRPSAEAQGSRNCLPGCSKRPTEDRAAGDHARDLL